MPDNAAYSNTLGTERLRVQLLDVAGAVSIAA